MIQVEALTKLYGDFVAVNQLTFSVQPGEVLGLVGAERCGQDHHVALPRRHHSTHARHGAGGRL